MTALIRIETADMMMAVRTARRRTFLSSLLMFFTMAYTAIDATATARAVVDTYTTIRDLSDNELRFGREGSACS